MRVVERDRAIDEADSNFAGALRASEQREKTNKVECSRRARRGSGRARNGILRSELRHATLLPVL
jgi:hypothetical protein